MKTKDKATTKSAIKILKQRHYRTKERLKNLDEARVNAQAARLIYQLRTNVGLSQKQLADLIGTTQSVVSRLEDDDYSGHSLSMLSKIATALNRKLQLSAI